MDLLHYLMRGGTYGHFWMKQSARTIWWQVSDIPYPPATDEDIYFGVHPSSVIKGPKERTLTDDIEAINCLYGDFDIKDFDDSREQLAQHIKSLIPVPSVVVDSGGGYHCYWLLNEPFLLETDLKTEIARDIQRNWTIYIGADLAAHDLPRILRIPGTLNYKYNPPRQVATKFESFNHVYKLTELQEILPQTPDHSTTKTKSQLPTPRFPNELSPQEIVDLATGANDGQKFIRLFRGVDTGYASASEADLAFCSLLAFWTGGDYEKMDVIFRASDRMRSKWERDDYRDETLSSAILQASEFYIDPGGLLTAGAHDEGNASCTFARIKDTVSYTEAMGWLQYRDGHWASELAETYVQDAIVETLKARRKAGVDTENDEIVKAAKPTAPHVRSAMELLKRKVAVQIEEFDKSPDELNCTNGILDLRTGELSPHFYKKRFTYCIPTRYNPDADPSYWLEWLLGAVGGDQSVVDYIQLALGYSLTGHTREEVMFYVWGPARAGKGVFIETIIQLLGGRPLATEVDIDLFMAKQGNSSAANFSLASLKAARFVAASESRENEWLNAKRVKRWTGRNFISCAHKYGRDFTYSPMFKIWLTSNFPPQMDADDEAAWGRVRIIRFPETHLGQEDKLLKDRMVQPDVLEGILAWIVEGAKLWYKTGGQGLKTPKAVIEAIKEAREDVDWVAAWIDEAVTKTDNQKDAIASDIYYQEYKDWCITNGVSPKSLRSLNRSLREAGYQVGEVRRYGTKAKRCWIGVRIGGYRQGLVKFSGNGHEQEEEEAVVIENRVK